MNILTLKFVFVVIRVMDNSNPEVSRTYYVNTSHKYFMNLKVVIEEDNEDGGFIVSCPALTGCHSEGETVEEALANITDAIQGCLAVLNERAQQSQYV